MTEPRALGEPFTFNVSRLLAEPPGASRIHPIAGAAIDLGDELRLADPLEGSIRLARTNRGLLIVGRMTASLRAECSRCLREIEVPIRITIEEEALPLIDLDTGNPADLSIEPDILRLTDHHELELEPTVRELVLLAEPIAPLCEAACPGLCIVCGQELRSGDHAHPDDDIDPRLEALRAFRVDDSEEDAELPEADPAGSRNSTPGG